LGQIDVKDMLIVCPSCASSYMIDPAAVGAAGRTVRCARCKASWHIGGPKAEPDVTAFVDSVIAEAEGKPPEPARAKAPPPPAAATQQASDDFGREASSAITKTENKAPPVEPSPPVPAPAEAQASEPEPVTIADAPSLVPTIEHAPLPEAADAAFESEEAESFDARRLQMQVRRKKSRRSSRWTAVILVLVACNVALVGARNEVVRYLPQTASLFAAIGLPVNLRGLKFADVKIFKEAQDGAETLIVVGAIVSEAGKAIEVPRLRFAARNATGQEVYTWTMPAPRSILGPGERLEFRSQIPAPPAEASDVMVRFFTAQDAAAGVK
jgi:predicted Zn finger-like uncharacterized protein